MPETKKSKLALATVIIFLTVAFVCIVAYHNFPNLQQRQHFPPVGWAPILEIGDSWKLALTSNEANYNLTITVIGKETVNNVSCNVMKLFFEPENPLVHKGVCNEMTW